MIILDTGYYTNMLADDVVAKSFNLNLNAPAVTDPVTGMTFGNLRFTNARANKIFVTLECLYGFTHAKTDALKRIVKP